MAATTSFINTILDTAFTGTFTVRLFKTSLPSTGGVELSGGSYAEQTLSFASAASKSKSASQVTFSNLPTGNTIVAYGIYKSGVLVDEKTLAAAYTPDLSTNEMKLTYTFSLNA